VAYTTISGSSLPKGSALGWFTACLVSKQETNEKENLAVWRHATCGDTHMQLALYPNACALLGGGDRTTEAPGWPGLG